ncbi:tRNA-splicing endonuclease subunit Sen34 [Termitomyces sp. T112]|nr:hypothetical protein C0989_003726 [Termitomyces sp. Mn162]KAG5728359.1 tRNA-splicing endonuclease subunit Sen34 [Termitomyces sp. T112]KAH0584330.1 hypothetical protein H2248_009873 [Termitomyces sp. 'cryptogamus']KNZ75462.1 tRNA-splicing endonuclease subunit Sen34 [Termitomyces sp. J132]
MAADSRRIPLRVSNKKAFIWDVDDIALVRSKHHICGVLSGTLPHLSQQNVFLGVPLLLMPEEAVLLVENELAVLIDDPTAHPQPSPQHLQKWDAEQQADIKRQMALLEAKEAKENEKGHAMTAEALEKRKAREERRAAKAKLAQESGDHSSLATMLLPESTAASAPSQSVEESSESKATLSVGHTVVIPTSSTTLEWYNTDPSCSYTTIAAAKDAGIWDYPSTPQERARCGVFRNLWERGYFMGGGIKFGGDYLVYPGDPLRYHSHFAATVLESPVFDLRPMEIVAHGRLGTATKKAHLMCSWDDEKKEVSYLTIEWAGFG